MLAPRTWADMGITLQPQAVRSFPAWVAAVGVGPVGVAQTVFQILPIPSPGTVEYMVEIDGQQLRYRNTPPQWASMVHPGTQGVPGARVTAVAFDGRNVELFSEAGQFGLKRLIEAAEKKRKDGGVHELRWSADGLSVAVELRITSSPVVDSDTAAPQQGFAGMRLPETIVGGGPSTGMQSAPAAITQAAPAAITQAAASATIEGVQ
jgi:type VI secretion system protein ImpL